MRKTNLQKGIILICTAACILFSCSTMDLAARYPNMVADLDPFSVGTIDVLFDQLFTSKLKAHSVNVIFDPRENIVALEFRYELVRYRQFWDQKARQHFAMAFEQYKQDFNAKTLSTKYNKTRAVYGKTPGTVEWETFKYTSTYKASPTLELGYRFRQDAPYFAVLQRSAKEETGAMSGSDMDSQQITMYYTKALGEKLMAYFNQEYLREMAGVSNAPKIEEPAAAPDPDKDDY